MDHSIVHEKDEKLEPGKLIEDRWFFGNLLDKKPKMLRSYSDPCTSSKDYRQEIDHFPGESYEETYASLQKLKLPGPEISRRGNLIRATSAPGKHQNPTPKGGEISNTVKTSAKDNLVRAPSHPISLENEDFQDEEMEFSMGKLIRQASLNDSDNTRPRKHVAKGLTRSCSISRHLSMSKSELGSLKKMSTIPQRPTNQLRTQKSLSDLEYEELQGFKDLGFDLEKKDLTPNVISIIPGLQEKKEDGQEKNTIRPYLSEAWRSHSSAPPVPRWGGRRSTDELKTQIKFWARAVASNVRQEC